MYVWQNVVSLLGKSRGFFVILLANWDSAVWALPMDLTKLYDNDI